MTACNGGKKCHHTYFLFVKNTLKQLCENLRERCVSKRGRGTKGLKVMTYFMDGL